MVVLRGAAPMAELQEFLDLSSPDQLGFLGLVAEIGNYDEYKPIQSEPKNDYGGIRRFHSPD